MLTWAGLVRWLGPVLLVWCVESREGCVGLLGRSRGIGDPGSRGLS